MLMMLPKNPLPDLASKQPIRVIICGSGPLGFALFRGAQAAATSCQVVGVFRWLSRLAVKYGISPHRLGQCHEPLDREWAHSVQASGIPDLQAASINGYAFAECLNRWRADVLLDNASTISRPTVLIVGSWAEI